MSFNKKLGMSLLLSVPLVLSGCVFDVKDNDMLSKPRLPVELEEINSVLREHFDTDLKLLTPLEGFNKKSIQFVDLDDDKEDEVIVLHSKESDQFAMKVTVLSKKSDKWRINTDIQGIGYDVNRIDYPDLDGDGVKEIVVGWQSGALLNKGISVYKHGEKGYSEIFKESYTAYVTGDIDNDRIDDLFLIKLSRSEGYARYVLYHMLDNSMVPVSEVLGDGYVNDYPNVKIGKVDSNRNGVFIDAKVGSVSGFTDLVYFNGNELISAFFNKRSQSTDKTFRQTERMSTDIDADGIIEIPVVYKGFGEPDSKSAQWITQWGKWDGLKGMLPALKSYDDLNQGYRLVLPSAWNDTIVLNIDNEGCLVYVKATPEKLKETVCQIRIVDRKNYEASRVIFEEKGFILLGKTLDKIFLGKVNSQLSEANQSMSITVEQLKMLFRIL